MMGIFNVGDAHRSIADSVVNDGIHAYRHGIFGQNLQEKIDTSAKKYNKSLENKQHTHTRRFSANFVDKTKNLCLNMNLIYVISSQPIKNLVSSDVILWTKKKSLCKSPKLCHFLTKLVLFRIRVFIYLQSHCDSTTRHKNFDVSVSRSSKIDDQ